jgi:hypothetical protein
MSPWLQDKKSILIVGHNIWRNNSSLRHNRRIMRIRNGCVSATKLSDVLASPFKAASTKWALPPRSRSRDVHTIIRREGPTWGYECFMLRYATTFSRQARLTVPQLWRWTLTSDGTEFLVPSFDTGWGYYYYFYVPFNCKCFFLFLANLQSTLQMEQ